MIRVSHLSRDYGPRPAILDLNFEIQSGEIVGFLGPNGAGKSTTMKIITGYMPPTKGTVEVAGMNVTKRGQEVKKHIGYLPENPPVYPEMKVKDYVTFAAKLHQVPKSQIKTAVANAIEKTGLGEVQHRLIQNLSKGYRQRVGLAQALVHNPKVLVLDEPTVGLDPKQIIEIRTLIKSLGGEHTVILSSHILPEVTATCQRVIIIHQGKLVAQDSLSDLQTKLHSGATVSMTVRNAENLQTAKPKLESVTGVRSVSISGEKAVIELDPKAGEVRDKILITAIQSGLAVIDFSADKLNLEDIFLQLTTQERGHA